MTLSELSFAIVDVSNKANPIVALSKVFGDDIDEIFPLD